MGLLITLSLIANKTTGYPLSTNCFYIMAVDLFPEFSSEYITTALGARIFVRVSPNKGKPPALLLHGFPQTHMEWHRVVPLLLPHYTVVLLDLRGYGASESIADSVNGSGYTKRLMAQDCVSVMDQLGYTKFTVIGHDRGARVTYRLAFDQPEKLEKVVLIDIIPTAAMFKNFGNVTAAVKAYHWLFMAQPEPFPETLMASADNGKFFLEKSLASLTGTQSLDVFDPVAMANYRESYCNEEKIHNACECYRAGAFYDRVYDEENISKGNKIQVPVYTVWGSGGTFAKSMKEQSESPLDVWKQYCSNVQGKGYNCGHFVPEEMPEPLAQDILQFLLA